MKRRSLHFAFFVLFGGLLFLSACSNQIGFPFRIDNNNGNDTPPPPNTDETVFSEIRLGDRNYLASVFKGIFPNGEVDAIVAQNILGRPGEMGGACDPYKIGDCANRSESRAASIPVNSPIREAYRMRTCLEISISTGAMIALMMTARNIPSFEPAYYLEIFQPPTREEISALYQKFFFPQLPTAEVAQSLVELSAAAADYYESDGFSIQAVNSWGLVFEAICSAPEWQVH